MMRNSKFFLGLLLFLNLAACQKFQRSQEHTILGTTMGTSYQIKIARVSIPEKNLIMLKQQIDSVLLTVNQQMSTYDPQSEISRFNAWTDTTSFFISEPLRYVVRTALEVNKESHGYFDITVAPLVDLWGFGKMKRAGIPPEQRQIETVRKRTGAQHLIMLDDRHLRKTIPDLELDLSAIAKGYGVDRVAELLDSLGYKNYLVEIGGELVGKGLNNKGELWKVAVDRPRFASLPGEQIIETLALPDVAVATSGDYRNYFEYRGRRYSHTIDPFTGYPVQHNLASATVIAMNCTRADALATAVMAMGPEKGLTWIENYPDVEALLIVRLADNKFEEFQTTGFVKYLLKKDNE
jgi:thiamine biosynthesis lipoprotein